MYGTKNFREEVSSYIQNYFYMILLQLEILFFDNSVFGQQSTNLNDQFHYPLVGGQQSTNLYERVADSEINSI